MRNRGVDVTVSTQGAIVGDLNYEFSIGFTHYKNKVLKVLDNPKATILSGLYNSLGTNRTAVGYEMAHYYGLLIDGIFNTQEEVDAYKLETTVTPLPPEVGCWYFKDINGDKKITDDDRTYMGSYHPDFQTSFSLSLNYRNLDLFTSLFWNQGGEIYGGKGYNIYATNIRKDLATEAWTPTHTNTLTPKFDINPNSGGGNNNFAIQDATYVRLKTLQLGYTLPSKWMSKVGIERLRIYVQSQNLFTFKKAIIPDPDAVLSPFKAGMLQPGLSADSGADLVVGVTQGAGANAPTPKQIIFGINLSL